MAHRAGATAKHPRTARGERTRRKLLDAAAAEFADSGFYEGSISAITRRAGVALGTFYTYFDSKDAIFRALVADMSEAVRIAAREAIEPDMEPLRVEYMALEAFLNFAAKHKEIYRIIDEAEFVDPDSYREHYQTTAGRIRERLETGVERGAFREALGETEAWAIMGMNVFLGLRYAIWGTDSDPGSTEISQAANDLLRKGLLR